MTDALTALDKIFEDVTRLTAALNGSRSKSVLPALVQPAARTIARKYFEFIRPELEVVESRTGLVEEIDFVLQAMLQLATAAREKQAYLGQIAELRPYLLQAMIDLMKARGAPRLVLSEVERTILETLARMLPSTSASYEQALWDIAQAKRVSWRGTALELREVLREVIDYLAPDEKVVQSSGFQVEQDQKTPTQKQKVRYILRARRSSSEAVAVAEASLATFEEAIATLARSTYRRGSVSTHTLATGTELRRLKRYVDALLAELLEVS